MIVIFKLIVPNGYAAITLWPFIVLKNKTLKDNESLINHEKIHLRQQIELLILPFYLMYGIEFIVNLIRYRNWIKAYVNISFEKEATAHDCDLNYLVRRPFWNFIKYF
ncbi:MAG: hypothetical protein HKP28_06750 [Winogradskyella sp.]|nr:hypothetical protein [Winogradskyella sp.]NNL83068.1 hypothetical protein [Winogradskyella sp.]